MHIYQHLFATIEPTVYVRSEKWKSISSQKVNETTLKKIVDMSLSLSELAIECYFDIYDSLDARSQACFRAVHRNLYLFALSTPILYKIEKLIQENYVDVEGKPIIDFKKFYSCRAFRVIGYGETHHRYIDHFLNSMVANFTHIPNMIYLSEGGQSSIDIWKEKKENLFRYFIPQIAETIKSWDLDINRDEEGSGILLKDYDFAKIEILVTQQLFKLYNCKKWSFNKFRHFLHKKFDKKLRNKFWTDLSAVQGFSIKDVRKDYREAILRSRYHLKFNKLILTYYAFNLILKSMDRPLDQARWDEIHRKRDERLRNCVFNSLSYNTTVVFAGSVHIRKLSEYYKHITSVKKLWLIPRDGISVQSVTESYFRIFFPGITPPSSPSVNQLSIREEPLTASLKDSNHSASEEDQIRTFLAFDVKKLDYSGNHYAFWKLYMINVIEVKMKRISSKISNAMISQHLWEQGLPKKAIKTIVRYLES